MRWLLKYGHKLFDRHVYEGKKNGRQHVANMNFSDLQQADADSHNQQTAHGSHLVHHLVNESEQGNFMGSPRADIQLSQALLDVVRLQEDELFFAFEEAAEQFPVTLQALM